MDLGSLIRGKRIDVQIEKEGELKSSDVKELISKVCQDVDIPEPKIRYRMEGDAMYDRGFRDICLPGSSLEEIGQRFRKNCPNRARHFDKISGCKFLMLSDKKLGIMVTLHELGHHYDEVSGRTETLVEESKKVYGHVLDRELPVENSADNFALKMIKEVE